MFGGSRNIFYVYKFKKYRSAPDAPADGQNFGYQLSGPIHTNRLAVGVYRPGEYPAETPRARGWIPGADGVLDPLDISLMFG